MSPLYEYRCRACRTVTERLRSYERRDDPVTCPHCYGEHVDRLPPLPHIEPDGIYSHTPNIGSAEAFERKRAKIRRELPGNAETL